MALPRPFALVQTTDQWLRAFHQHTALENGVVQLALDDEDGADRGTATNARALGLAFDRYCRLYRTRADGRVLRERWAAGDPTSQAQDLLGRAGTTLAGDFRPTAGSPPLLREPGGIAIDEDDRLFIADTGGRRLLMFDLWSRRLLRRVAVPGAPVDLVLKGQAVLALLASPSGLVELRAHSGPSTRALPGDIEDPGRLAIGRHGQLFFLDHARTADAHIRSEAHTIDVPFASDLECLPNGVLVVARGLGQDFRRFRVTPTAVEELSPLKARGYDGLGIVRTPDDRVGFVTANGFRHAVPARTRYQAEGRVVTYQLDSGEFGTVWGRLFLDACIPADTTIGVSAIATDSPDEADEALPRRLPDNVTNAVIVRPDLSPPMPPLSLVPIEPFGPLHRRESGRELPFAPRQANDPFQTYETPILTEPGRYLWIALQFIGNTRTTPRLRSLRAEHPSHDYLRRLPKVFSRETAQASFLRRYLALFDGLLGELDARSSARHALLDPDAAPAEVLAWLAGFVGLVIDERWPVVVQRAILDEVAWLFRFRGTVRGLTRFLELYTGAPVIIVEKYRLRGLGATADGIGPSSRAVLGGGFRVGGAIDDDTSTPIAGSAADAFETHAHRFTVLIAARLTTEQLDVVHRILDLHRPAHTLVEVCTIDAGIRVGRGLHIGLTSAIGRSGGFTPLQTGQSFIGRDAIVGRPLAGARLDASRLGRDSRVG